MSTRVVTVLMKRLLEIDAICNPDRQQAIQESEDSNLDSFTLAKRNLAKFIAEIREVCIKFREEFYSDKIGFKKSR